MSQINRPEIESTPLQTKYGEFKLFVFSWGANEQDNVLVLEKGGWTNEPCVRVQSACYTGEIFESTDCDCHWQLENGLIKIHQAGGYFVYMLQDGRGAGLLTKIRGMNLTAEKGIDTAQAYMEIGSPLDPRDYSRTVYILNYFKLTKVRLLTNNPRKIHGIEAGGISVVREPHQSEPTSRNISYLRAKKDKLGHLMDNID